MGFRDTTKGTIFFDIADIISRTNPRAIFLENVENLGFLIPIVTKGRGAKYKAGVTRGTKINIEE